MWLVLATFAVSVFVSLLWFQMDLPIPRSDQPSGDDNKASVLSLAVTSRAVSSSSAVTSSSVTSLAVNPGQDAVPGSAVLVSEPRYPLRSASQGIPAVSDSAVSSSLSRRRSTSNSSRTSHDSVSSQVPVQVQPKRRGSQASALPPGPDGTRTFAPITKVLHQSIASMQIKPPAPFVAPQASAVAPAQSQSRSVGATRRSSSARIGPNSPQPVSLPLQVGESAPSDHQPHSHAQSVESESHTQRAQPMHPQQPAEPSMPLSATTQLQQTLHPDASLSQTEVSVSAHRTDTPYETPQSTRMSGFQESPPFEVTQSTVSDPYAFPTPLPMHVQPSVGPFPAYAQYIGAPPHQQQQFAYPPQQYPHPSSEPMPLPPDHMPLHQQLFTAATAQFLGIQQTHQSQITDLQSSISSLQASLSRSLSDLATKSESLSQLQDQLRDFKDQLRESKDQLRAQTEFYQQQALTRNAAHDAQTSELQATIREMQASHEAQIHDLLASHEAQVALLQSRLSEFEARSLERSPVSGPHGSLPLSPAVVRSADPTGSPGASHGFSDSELAAVADRLEAQSLAPSQSSPAPFFVSEFGNDVDPVSGNSGIYLRSPQGAADPASRSSESRKILKDYDNDLKLFPRLQSLHPNALRVFLIKLKPRVKFPTGAVPPIDRIDMLPASWLFPILLSPDLERDEPALLRALGTSSPEYLYSPCFRLYHFRTLLDGHTAKFGVSLQDTLPHIGRVSLGSNVAHSQELLVSLRDQCLVLAETGRRPRNSALPSDNDLIKATDKIINDVLPPPLKSYLLDKLQRLDPFTMPLFDFLDLLIAICKRGSRLTGIKCSGAVREYDPAAQFADDVTGFHKALGSTESTSERAPSFPITACEVAQRILDFKSPSLQSSHSSAATPTPSHYSSPPLPVPSQSAVGFGPPPRHPPMQRQQHLSAPYHAPQPFVPFPQAAPFPPRAAPPSQGVPSSSAVQPHGAPPQLSAPVDLSVGPYFTTRAEALKIPVCRQHAITGSCTCPVPRSHHLDPAARAAVSLVLQKHRNGCVRYIIAGNASSSEPNATACPHPESCSYFHPQLSGHTILDAYITRKLRPQSASTDPSPPSGPSPGSGSGGSGSGGGSGNGSGSGAGQSSSASPAPAPAGGDPGSTGLPPGVGRFAAKRSASQVSPSVSCSATPGLPLTRASLFAFASLLASSSLAPPVAATSAPPLDLRTVADPSIPPLTRAKNHLNGAPFATLECAGIPFTALFDTCAVSNHYVTQEFVDQISRSPSRAAQDLGFRVGTLDTPQERTVIGNVVSNFTRYAIIPARFFAFLHDPCSNTFSPVECANESDTYFILPPLPDNATYPTQVILSSPVPFSDPLHPNEIKWTTFLRLLVEQGRVFIGKRHYPSMTSTEPTTALQLVSGLGVVIRAPDDPDDSSSEEDDTTFAPAVPSVTSHSVHTTPATAPVVEFPPKPSPIRGRTLHRVTFAPTPASASRPEGTGARPLSAPPYRRDVVHDDEPMDLSGYTSDSEPLSHDVPSDADIRARFDYAFITQNGARPELFEEVWEITKDVLRKVTGPIPPTEALTVEVGLNIRPGSKPPFRRQPRFTPEVTAQICAELDRLEDAGILIEPPPDIPDDVNNIVFGVPKGLGIRVVSDFSPVNSITVNDTISTLPKDMFALMHGFYGCAIFSYADCKDAFYAIRLARDAWRWSAIRRPDNGRRLCYTRATMGGRDNAEVCHSVIHGAVTSPQVPGSHNNSYMDDLLLGSRPVPASSDPHRALVLAGAFNLVAVFSSLIPTCQRVKLSKTLLLTPVGNLTGFQTDGKLVWVEPSRLAPLKALPLPTSMAQAQRFRGLLCARSQFIAHLAPQLKIVQDFLKLKKWPHTGLPADVAAAFTALRDAVVENTPLHLLDPSLPVHVRNDSSATGTGGHIGQYDQYTGLWRDIAYFHHTFTAIQQRYSTIIREFLGLVLNMLRHKHLLRGCKVIGWCDHQNLMYLSKSDNDRILRLALTLLGAGIDCSILYDPDHRMVVCDTLSRISAQPSPLSAVPSASSASPSQSLGPIASPVPAFLAVTRSASAALATSPAPAAMLTPEASDIDITADVSPAEVHDSEPLDLHACPFIPSIDIIRDIPFTKVTGLPPNVHPLVHSVIAAQQAMSPSDRAAFLKRPHAVEKRFGTVLTLYVSGRLYIPPSADAVRTAYLAAVHDIVCAREGDMLERLRNSVKVFWDSMAVDAAAYRKTCGRCQHASAGTQPVAVGTMQSHLYSAPNDTLFMDIYGPLQDCVRRSPFDLTGALHTYRYIFSLTDGYSRLTAWLPSTHKSAEAAVAAFTHWTSWYGIPRIVRTDADVVFASSVFRKALAQAGSIHDPVPPYTHHQMGLLERTHAVLGNLIRILGGHAVSEWVDHLPVIIAWKNSCMNRSLGVSSYEAFFSRPPTFAYDRLGINSVSSVTPNELSNICAAQDLCIRTSASVATAHSAAYYDSSRLAPPVFNPGDTVLVYFEDRPTKSHTYYRGPFVVLSPADLSGNYYTVRDMVQLTEYTVHVERMKPFDMSRTTLAEQAQRQLPSSEYLIVTGVDGHRMNELHGQLEFCVRYYSGNRAWRLYPDVQNLDVVKQYVAEHKLNTRKQTPSQQYARLVRPSRASKS